MYCIIVLHNVSPSIIPCMHSFCSTISIPPLVVFLGLLLVAYQPRSLLAWLPFPALARLELSFLIGDSQARLLCSHLRFFSRNTGSTKAGRNGHLRFFLNA